MKLAFIGSGKIIETALGAISPEAGIKYTAIYAHSNAERAETLAKRYGISRVYTDYAGLLSDSGADTVYIGLANIAHYAYAKEALTAGRNVILEKPFTASYDQTAELCALAEKKGLFLFEAMTVLHSDIFDEMRRALPELGQIRAVLANYSQYSSRYDAYLQGKVTHTFDPEAYGGALTDINVYNIYYCAALFGRPDSVVYRANRGFNGVDTSGILLLGYDGFSCACTGAKDSDSPCFVSVQGESGWMRIGGKPNAADNLTVCVTQTNGAGGLDAGGGMQRDTREEHYETPKDRHRMTREFNDFADIIRRGDLAAAQKLLEITLCAADILERAR